MADDARMTSPGGGMADAHQTRVREILAAVKPLAAEFYALTNKPLGVTGEIAEYLAADTLGLELAVARTAGYDAIRHTPAGPERIQIKGRAVSGPQNAGRISRIKLDADCNIVLLVLMETATLDPIEMWEAPYWGHLTVCSKMHVKRIGRSEPGGCLPTGPDPKRLFAAKRSRAMTSP